MPKTMQRRRSLAVLVTIGLAAIAIWLGSGGAASVQDASALESLAEGGAPAAQGPHLVYGDYSDDGSGNEPAPGSVVPGTRGSPTQARHLARFRPGSAPFSPSRDPAARRRVQNRVTLGQSSFDTWLEAPVAYVGEPPPRLCARSLSSDPVSHPSLVASVRPDRQRQITGEFALQPDGCGPGTVGAPVPPSGLDAPGLYEVSIDDGGRGAPHPLRHIRRRARLGQLREEVVDGDLRVQVQIDVEVAGAFWLVGSLYHHDGGTLGWASARAELSPGVQIVDLTYQGLLFCDAGWDGTFELRTLRLVDVTTPAVNADNDYRESALTTAAYSASRFRCAEYGDPNQLRRARLAEARRER